MGSHQDVQTVLFSSPIEQPQCPKVQCAAHRRRRIGRSSNVVEATETVPNTKHSTPPVSPNRANVAKVSTLWLSLHKPSTATVTVHQRDHQRPQQASIRSHSTRERHQTRVPRSKRGGTSTWAANGQPPGRTGCVLFIANRTAAVPQTSHAEHSIAVE